MKTILQIVKKEFLQFKRDPKMFAMVLVAPVIQLIFFGYAATLDVNIVHTAVYDMDKSVESRSFLKQFEESGYFNLDYYIDDYDKLNKLFDEGEVIFCIVIPTDFQSKLNRNETVKIQGIFDGSDGNTASIASGYFNNTILSYNKNILTSIIAKRGTSAQQLKGITAESRVWYNPELKTRVFMVPAIAGLLLMVITLILTSLAVVKEKEIGTLEQLIVTPIKPYQLILGKLLPFKILGLIAVVIVLTAMSVIFGIHIRGNVIFLFVTTSIYVLSLLGFGLFISTISNTQQQAMMLAMFVVMLPMVYLSGFAFPIENMPEVIQWVTYAIPLRYYITIIRGVVLKGIGFEQLWFDVLMLLILSIVILYLSSLRFKKNID